MTRYQKYSKEFKLQAAKLVIEQGYSYEYVNAGYAILSDYRRLIFQSIKKALPEAGLDIHYMCNS